ncbi:hypothetical protein M0R45_001873 [Rubus argutus]|uniref:Uncharacterized protein n=1 Tax=Rubus argutus TaxID=59490 RepID=A0AAW1VFG9_RUBAR
MDWRYEQITGWVDDCSGVCKGGGAWSSGGAGLRSQCRSWEHGLLHVVKRSSAGCIDLGAQRRTKLKLGDSEFVIVSCHGFC